MKVLAIRWGETLGGMYGMSGPDIVEIMVSDQNGHNYFVLNVSFLENETDYISEVSLFDVMKHSDLWEVDADHERAKLEKFSSKTFEFNVDEPEEISYEGSKFGKVIDLARLALDYKPYCDDEKVYLKEAQKFIEPYLDQEIDEMEIPVSKRLEVNKFFEEDD